MNWGTRFINRWEIYTRYGFGIIGYFNETELIKS